MTSTEFQYINTLSSNAQTQINARVKWLGEVSSDPVSPDVSDMWFNYTAAKVRIKTSGSTIDLN